MTFFETELQVRPDDIDMNRHVHSSRYIDYVLAARYDQMERCYCMSMQQFIAKGYGWIIRRTEMEFRRALVLGDRMIVKTGIEELLRHGVVVRFEVRESSSGHVACRGSFHYVLIRLDSGSPASLPPEVVEKYSI